MKLRINSVDLGKKSFQNSYKALSDDIKQAFKDAYPLLLEFPQPSKLRLHGLTGIRNPKVYTIDITTNHSHKLSFELNGDIAVFRRIGTHKDIDRKP